MKTSYSRKRKRVKRRKSFRKKNTLRRKSFRKKNTSRRKTMKGGKPIRSHHCPSKIFKPFHAPGSPHVVEVIEGSGGKVDNKPTKYKISFRLIFMKNLKIILSKYEGYLKGFDHSYKYVDDESDTSRLEKEKTIMSDLSREIDGIIGKLDTQPRDHKNYTKDFRFNEFKYLNKLIQRLKNRGWLTHGHHWPMPVAYKNLERGTSIKQVMSKKDCDRRVDGINKLLEFFSERTLVEFYGIGPKTAYVSYGDAAYACRDWCKYFVRRSLYVKAFIDFLRWIIHGGDKDEDEDYA